MQEKLLKNLKRYSQIAVVTDEDNADLILGELAENKIDVLEIFSVDTSNFLMLTKGMNEISSIKSPCLLVAVSRMSYLLTQKLLLELSNKIDVINLDSFSDFYEGQFGVISKYVRPQRDEKTVFNGAAQNPNIANMYDYAELLMKKTPLFKTIEIETYNRCNGSCSFCPVNFQNDTRVPEKMSESLLYSIITQLQTIQYNGRISLYSNNEPLLDDRIFIFSKLLYERLPFVKVHMFTNGTLLDEERFLSLIPYLDELIIDNYNDDFSLMPNIQRLCDRFSDEKFFRKVKIVLRRRNELLSTRGGYAPNRTIFPDFSNARCVLPFVQMVIRPNGTIALCCNAPLSNMVLGDARKCSLTDIWYGARYQNLRASIVKGRAYVENCKTCDAFQYY